MSTLQVGILFGIATFVALFSGMPIAFAVGGVALVFMLLYMPSETVGLVAETLYSELDNFVLLTIPLFVLMGAAIGKSRAGGDLYSSLNRWMGRIPGGLGAANVMACSVFAAMCGSSPATCSAIGSSGIPEMRKRGYSPGLAAGIIAAGGTLGILIPPSIILIVYGVLAEESIGALYMAGVVPGLLLTAMFMAAIAGMALIRPSIAPREPAVGWREKLRLSVAILPVAVLVFLVLGTIYMGVATPTEAASLGVVGAFVLAAVSGKVDLRMLKETCLNTVNTTAMVILIVSAAFMLNFVLAIFGVPQAMATMVTNLGWSPNAILWVLIAFYLVMGTFMDEYSMLVTTIPVVLPIVKAIGVDLVWFGILITVLVEVALISPPHGLNLFVLHNVRMQSTAKGERQGTMIDLFLGVLPYMVVMLVLIGLLVAYPAIATWLPAKMRG